MRIPRPDKTEMCTAQNPTMLPKHNPEEKRGAAVPETPVSALSPPLTCNAIRGLLRIYVAIFGDFGGMPWIFQLSAITLSLQHS